MINIADTKKAYNHEKDIPSFGRFVRDFLHSLTVLNLTTIPAMRQSTLMRI